MKQKYKILHLEDLPSDAEMVRNELLESKMEFDHLVIDTEAEYLSALREFHPDIILCDHSLPAFNSYLALKIVKEKGLHIPFILITATMTEEVALNLVRSGADDYILKDRLKRLPSVVTNSIDKYRIEKERIQLIDQVYEKDQLAKDLLTQLSTKILLATTVASIGIWEYLFYEDKFIADDILLGHFGLSGATFKNNFEPLIACIHPDDRVRVVNDFESSLQGNSEFSAEFRIIRETGSTHFIKSSAVLQFDEGGFPSRLIGSSQDISASKVAERALRESETKYRTLFEQNVAGIYQSTTSGNIINCNEAFSRMLGYSAPGELFGKPIWELYVSVEEGKRFNQRILRKEKLINCEQILKDKAGDPIHVLETVSYRTDSETGEEYCDSILADITEKKHIEIALRQSNERLLNVCKATSDAVWDWDLKNGGLYLGDGFKELFGYDIKTKSSLSDWSDHIHPDDREMVIRNRFDKIDKQNKDRWIDRYRFIKADGSVAFVTDRGILLSDENGPYGMIGAMQDVTVNRELENLLFNANSMARLGSWELDLVKQNLYWSEITKEIHEVAIGYEPDLETAVNFYKQGEYRDLIMKNLNESINTGKPWDEELIIITGKGNEKWVRAIGEAKFEQGKCVKIFGSFQDIDTGKRNELEITQVLQEKYSVLESIGDAFFAVDNSWNVTYWNKEAEKIFAKSKAEILENNLWTIFPDFVGTVSYEKYHRALRLNESAHFEDYYDRFGKWYEISVYPSAKGLSVYFKDISERKIADDLLASVNNRLLLATSSAGMGIWEWNIEDNLISGDDEMARIYQVNPAEFESDYNGWISRLHPEDKYRIDEDMQMAVTDERKYNSEFRIIWSDLSIRYIRATGLIERDANGEAVRMIGVNWDITERRLSEIKLKDLNAELEKHTRELAVSNEELEQFAYVASHDLQEPLRMVTSFLTQLERKYSDVIDDKGTRYIAFAVDGAKRMRKIILDLLEFSRVGRTKYSQEELDLTEVIKEVNILFREQIAEKSANIIADHLPVIRTYKAPILLIFQNLIGNALKYTHSGKSPQIRITAVESEAEWVFSVSDNGIGIGEEYFERIFIIFQRLHNKDEFSGTGMGLAVTKKIVENLGGRIWVESEEGKGSIFSFSLLKQQ